jgi:hypothetical protein
MNIAHFLSVRFSIRLKRTFRKLQLTKRQQFVIVTLLLSAGLLLTQVVSPEFRFVTVAGLSVVTYILCAFAVREDLAGIEWLTLLSLPTLFTAAVAVFYFLLPVRWLTRIPVVVLYAVSMYALLLTENIYNVAANRTIALLRAAHTVGFLLTLVACFLLVQTVLALRAYPYVSLVGVGCVSFLLTLQSLWSVVLEPTIETRVMALAIVTTVAMVEIAWILAFWPVATTTQALFLTTCLYGMVGMGQQYLQDKLYKKTVTEFFVVVGIIFLIVAFSTHWRALP